MRLAVSALPDIWPPHGRTSTSLYHPYIRNPEGDMDDKGLHIETHPREGDPLLRAGKPDPCIIVLFGATGDRPSASSSRRSSNWRARARCPTTSPSSPSAAPSTTWTSCAPR
ncbi:hypothetical protein ACN28S_65825 [Cystobacter fuscus]